MDSGTFVSKGADGLQATPRANRLQIGFFGPRNAGKSSLLNALSAQDVVIVSDVAGTTTDPVAKNMEIHGLGACTLIDTAGVDDVGALGAARVEKTRQAALEADIAIVVFGEDGFQEALSWWRDLKDRGKACIPVVTKADRPDREELVRKVSEAISETPLLVSAETGAGIEGLRHQLVRMLPQDFEMPSIIGDLVTAEDVVLLVVPQDIQAPKGRLILPQVQTIRDLLDRHCVVLMTATEQMPKALAALQAPPALIITDSQVFPQVYAQKPQASKLTSFSILMAAYKGDLATYRAGAEHLKQLPADGRVLIAECCTHAPLEEDIGRVKLPRLLRQKISADLQIDVVSGRDYPEDLTPYDLIIQCGACMFNRRYVLARIERAKSQGVPISNYGVILAALNDILDHVSF